MLFLQYNLYNSINIQNRKPEGIITTMIARLTNYGVILGGAFTALSEFFAVISEVIGIFIA